MMDKLHKWNKNIADGSGFWTVCRDGYRLFYMPFDDKLVLERPEQAEESNDGGVTGRLIDELLDYMATTIRPISIMSGNQQAWDNMLQTKGHGFC